MKNKVIKSGMWYVASNFLIKGMMLITTPIFTRLLSQDEFGDYSNYISWLNIFQYISTLNVQATLLSAKYEYKEKFDKYIFSVLTLSTCSIVIWLIAFNVFSEKLTRLLCLEKKYISLIFIYLIFLTAVILFQYKEHFFYRYKRTVIISLCISFSNAFLSIILVLTLKDRLYARIIGSSLPTIFIGLLIYLTIALRAKSVDFSCWKYAIPLCLPYIPHLLSMTLLNSMDRIMITKYCGSVYTALYSVAYTCGSAIVVLITSLNEAFVPWLGEKLDQKEYQKIKKFSYFYICLFIYLACGVLLLTPEIIMVLGGKAYYEARYVIPPVAMGCICQFIYTMFVNIEQFKKKTVGMAFASMAAAVLNYMLNYFLIPKYGYIAAAYTTLAGFLCLLLLHMLLVYRLNLSFVYDYKFIFIVIVGMFFLMAGINYLYMVTVLRVICIVGYLAAIIIVLLKNRNRSLLKNF